MTTPATINGKTVKNLGYLLRNWSRVVEFRVTTQNLTNPGDDALFVAELYGGDIYQTGFASSTILLTWIKRPVFYGVPLYVDGVFKGEVSK